MTSPTKELQGVIYQRLINDAPLIAVVGTEIYKKVPKGAVFPRIDLSPTDQVQDDAECITNSIITMQVNIWSREPDMAVHDIEDLVKVALRTVEITMTVNALSTFEYRNTVYMDDPDGITTHAAMFYTAFVEQP